ncbi:MAG: DUF1016 N-terminal domain-containing protein, partial [Hyphomonadaceae bacterium]|nr:DUF1016 N-terminal domain-containing protein [Hyphomonadaceae bacterium]
MNSDEYSTLLDSIKAHVRAARLRAAAAVNSELVLLYWQIGCEILKRQAEQGWGAKIVDRLSLDMKREFPDVRGIRVLLDCHAAEYFEVEPKTLHAAVKRHQRRFPADFMLVFVGDEAAHLDRRLLASSRKSRKLPSLGFTGVGIDMLASVLKSKRAVAHSVENIREGVAAF